MADQAPDLPSSLTPSKPASRPLLTSSMRSSSYLSDHQQYRPPTRQHQHVESHFGIDHIVRDVDVNASPARRSTSPQKPFVQFNGIPSPENPPTIVESGLDHSFSHRNCAPEAGESTTKLIATLFYKLGGHGPSAVAMSPLLQGTAFKGASSSPPTTQMAQPEATGSQESVTTIPENLAPTTSLDKFPLEPPSTTEPEHLDLLYGSYVSQFCVTSFLHLMSSFPPPPDSPEPYSSHRCLESPSQPRVVELTLSPAPSPDYLALNDLRKHELIYRFEREWSVDVVLQPDTIWRRHPRLVVFDMDSTLIMQEVIELLAETVTEKPDLAVKIADITSRAMAGELEFEGAFRERVALLKGVPVSRLTDLRNVITVTPGVRELLRGLRRLGVKTAVLSGGFQPLTQWLAGELGINYAHANEVEVDDQGLLTGEVKGAIVGAERKAALLQEIALKEDIGLSQVVAVGDGANDLKMMAVAGLGVAWHAKPRVQMEAGARLNGDSMTDLLYLFGFTSDEVASLCA